MSTPAPQPKKTVRQKATKRPAKRKRQSQSNVLQEITRLVSSEIPKQEFYRQSFRLITKHFNAQYGVLNVRLGAATLQDEYVAEEHCAQDVMAVVDAMTIEVEAEERSNVRLFKKEPGKNIAVLSTPIFAGPSHIGSMCMATTTPAGKEARLLLSELIALVAFLGSQQSTDEQSVKRSISGSSGINRALQKAAKYESVKELAYSMVNNIAGKFHCEQVAFGLHQARKVRLVAISGLDRFSRSSHGVQMIQQAMEECSDAEEAIHYQLQGGYGETSGAQSFLLHRHWHRSANNASIYSVPLKTDDGDVVAVISLQRSANRPFDNAELYRIHEMLSPFASVVYLLEKSSRPLFEQARLSMGSYVQRLREPNRTRQRATAALLAAAALFFLFGRLPHRVSVPCVIQPATSNHVAAPFEGTLREVNVRNGEEVTQGQVIAKLDARPLELERDRLQSEIAALQIDLDRALTDRTVAEAAMAATSIDASQKQLAIVEDRIAKANIVSPIDGVVLRGELEQRVGQLLQFGDPLLEIGDRDGRHVELQIPESSAHFVRIGQRGKFVSFARPGTPREFEIERLTGASTTVDGKNVFLADGKLNSSADWMRVGMEGTAKVHAGWEPTWWLATHGLVNRLRLMLWW